MIEIEEMSPEDTHFVLREIHYAHLGCASREGRPYVVPITTHTKAPTSISSPPKA